ncbi:4-demethylwyosine synthase TYW1 [Candidatus Woesearchaeota archaeon]|nr:4-demethylwyosine synthase TYW1 [Candidatus Woesearchaeota archaeon]
MQDMITKEIKKNLEKQGYRTAGSHSAVKICGWTKKTILGKGTCYKHKFYGINTHQCLQMTTSMSCANRCVFCWRDYKSPVSKDWIWNIDEPNKVLEEAKEAHHKLLIGFFGNDKTDKKALKESKKIKHAALSLTGEPINYPKVNELIQEMHKQRISTFLVTNGQNPESIKKLGRITQLYLSVDGADKETLRETGKPLFTDYWERLLKSLEELKEKKYRTCIRITLIKGMNDKNPEKYAELIKKAEPDFVEVKSYMFIGASKERLKKENMPTHTETMKFTEQIQKHLPNYELMSDHKPSRVALLTHIKHKIRGKWKTWIDFEAFFQEKQEYNTDTPKENIIIK